MSLLEALALFILLYCQRNISFDPASEVLREETATSKKPHLRRAAQRAVVAPKQMEATLVLVLEAHGVTGE
jgi:hypothetical protein